MFSVLMYFKLLMCSIGAEETFLIIISVENRCAA